MILRDGRPGDSPSTSKPVTKTGAALYLSGRSVAATAVAAVLRSG
jgi:hypothetical protein